MISFKLQVCMFKSQDKTKNWYDYKHLKEIVLVQNMEAQNIFQNLFFL